MDNGEGSRPSQLFYKPPRVPKGAEVFQQKLTPSAGGGGQRISINLNPSTNLEQLAVSVVALRANDRDVIPGATKRKAFRPNSPIGRNRNILDEEK